MKKTIIIALAVMHTMILKKIRNRMIELESESGNRKSMTFTCIVFMAKSIGRGKNRLRLEPRPPDLVQNTILIKRDIESLCV